MNKSTFQTLHPSPDKKNKVISLEKYEVIRTAILEVLHNHTLNHTELLVAMQEKINHFSGNIHWYCETVKLDLEARGLIKRNNSKPPGYSLVDHP